MSTYIVEAFGLNDRVTDLKTHKVYASGYRLNTLTVEDDREIITGKKANAYRVQNGFEFPRESRIDDSDLKLNRRFVAALWNRLTTDPGNQKIRLSYRPRVTEERRGNVYLDYLLSEHIEGLVKEFLGQDTLGRKDNLNLVIPIPNQLSEYAQEYLIRGLRRHGISVTFLWRQIAALINCLSHKGSGFREKQKVKVVYLGADAFESAVFALKKDRNVLVPVRTRPKFRRALLSGIDYFAANLTSYLEAQGFTANKALILQILNTRKDIIESSLGLKPEPTALPLICTENGRRNFRLLNTVKSGINSERAIAQCFINRETAESGLTEKAVPLCDFVTAGADYDCIVLCGSLATEGLYKQLKDKAACEIYFEPGAITQGCEKYLNNLKKGLPTYYDSLPGLEIAYLDKKRNQYAWETLIASGTLVRGGEEFRSKEPYTGLGMETGSDKMPVYLRVESDLDDGIRYAEKKFAQKAEENIFLSMNVSMKPASGLARLEVTDRSDPGKKSFLFDYSEMVKKDLPKLGLAYPEEFKQRIHAGDLSADLIARYNELRNINPANIYAELGKFVSILYKLKDAVRTPSPDGRMLFENKFDIGLKAGNTANQTVLDNILILTDKLSNKVKLPQTDYLSPEYYSYITAVSYLYGRVPGHLKTFLNEFLMGKKPGMDKIKLFYPCCRVFCLDIPGIKLIFNYYNSLSDEERTNNNFTMWAMVFLLENSPVAKKCLSKRTAENLLKQSIHIYQVVTSPGFSVHSRDAKTVLSYGIRLLLVSLKYRCIDNDFLDKTMMSAQQQGYLRQIVSLMDKLQEKIEGLSDSDPVKINFDQRLKNYRKVFEDFIDKKGDQSFLVKALEL